ncbi:hypothetical protein [Bacillus sp. REN16]|uniref:hypothetical protein n=1 Tax=Bacillus sp. REN16 TaxID=2887296 RepID=UPI001E56C172|nr:hypothetical protein [Bacillus sp. REN16]MCC3359492.1 hypothetical protein [Bacillus sp. REN16]
MSKDKARRETYLKIHSKLFPEHLSKIIGEEIVESSIKCELRMFKSDVNKNGKPIDLYGITRERGIKVYVEFQIGPSDICNHFEKKIKPIIQNIQDGIVIWVAADFKPGHITLVKELLKTYPYKLINFYAVQINPRVLDLLSHFKRGDDLHVYYQLDMINRIGLPPLSLVDDFALQNPPTYIAMPFKEEENTYYFSNCVDENRYLLTKLRKVINYYLNFHTEKESVVNKALRVSAGKDSIYYDATVCDNAGKGFVKICFGKSYSKWYQTFKTNNNILKERISPDIYFNDGKRTISYYLPSSLNNIPEVVDNLIEVYERFILFFSPFTYGRRNPTEILNFNFDHYNKSLFKNTH